ncbi:MAG: sensor histidine kinase [Acidobacteria bacterium]|nr:MAG: sensor histidine kinase [Acidobacteriota bacterium]
MSRSPRWLWIAVLWGGMGLFDATETVFSMRSQGMHHNWPQLFITILLSWLPWALATPVIMQLGRRFPPTGLHPLSTWIVHLGAAAAINFLSSAWRAFMDVMMNPWAKPEGPGSFTSLLLAGLINGVLVTIIFYASILAIAFVLDSREKIAQQQAETARLNEQLSKAQLDALRHQFEPHFLFNALNAVSALVRENRNDDAVNMIAGLSDLLRRVLQDSGRQQVPLYEELELLDKYLAIQKVRFSDRLRVDAEIPAELLQAQIPSLMLQPMVENALKHGIAKLAQGGAIRIAASRVNGDLNLTVFNDGPQLSSDWHSSGSGVGLSNLVTRLRGLYGDQFEFSLSNADSGGVLASVSLPYAAAGGKER